MALKLIPTNSNYRYYSISVVIVVCAGVLLYLMGRLPICACGYIKFWHGNPFSSENSQHITDYYTFSHIIHGFIFYWVLWKCTRQLPTGMKFMIAVLVETAWELFENSNTIIERYRATTISLDYYGDTVINALSDIVAMMIGYKMAERLRTWIIVVLALLMEVVVGYLIRDNLLLNVVMLIYPFDFILQWQKGG